MQRTDYYTGREPGIRGSRLGPRGLGRDMNDRVERRVHMGDVSEVGLDDLFRRALPGSNCAGKRCR
jgi:hypothetical protein